MMTIQRRLASLKRQRDAFFKELERRQKLDAAKAKAEAKPRNGESEIKVEG